MACRECHIAKVKCDKVIPCSRCVRLSKVCVRHESRQGQGRNKKRARSKVSEDATISTEVGTLKPNHYGLQYLVRSWVALSLRRRNFGLLARAGMIADRSGISMDQIFCENGNQRGMDFLYSLLLTSAPNQQVLGNRLSWSEIPHPLLVATGCVGATDSLHDPVVADRWIWIREIRQGVSRYLVTPAFDRDIADWNLIQQTYQENNRSVVELFLNPTEIGKHTKAFAHQISLHATPGLAPRSSRMRSKVKLKNKKGGAQTTECDQVFCLTIENLDHDFTYQEYVPRVGKTAENPPTHASTPHMAGPGPGVAAMANNNIINSNNHNLGMGTAAMGVALGLQRQQQALMNNGTMAQEMAAMNNNQNGSRSSNSNSRVSSAEVDADAAFKSGLDIGLPLLDLDNFDDDADLDFFLNVLK